MLQLKIHQYLIVTAIIVGLIRYRRLSPSFLRLMIPFLLLSFFAEVIPRLKLIDFRGSNHWWFNIFTVIEFLFYTYLFFRAIISSRLKRTMQAAMPVYLAIAAINIFFIQGFQKFHTISYRIGAIMIVVWCYLYFRQLLQQTTEMKLLRNGMFWIATGLLFFYLGFFLYMNAFDYIVYRNIDIKGKLFTAISDSLNILLYACFTTALLCSSNNKSYSSSL